MAISLRTNIASISANNALNRTNDRINSNMTRLSSGLRINRAGDDAAGLAISEKFQADLRSIQQLKRNANDGISLIQVAEGAMSEVSNILMRMRELAIQGATDTVSTAQKAFLSEELGELRQEIDRIGLTASFNGITLLSGNYTSTSAITFQVGLTGESAQQIGVSLSTMSASSLGVTGISFAQSSLAQASLSVIDSALTNLSAARSVLGAAQNRLQVSINNMATQFTNLSAANSRIRDVDVAEETAAMSRNQILMQSGVSVLAQANQIPQLALGLLQG